MTTDQELDKILDKFGGLLLGNWQPRPGEEGMVYPTRLKDEAKAAIEAHCRKQVIGELEKVMTNWLKLGDPECGIKIDERIAELRSKE